MLNGSRLRLSAAKRSFIVSLVGLAILAIAFSQSQAQTVIGTVAYDHPTGLTVNRYTYSLDAFQAFDPTIAGVFGSAAYKAHVAAMNAGILRYHYAGEMDDSTTDSSGWVVSPTTSSYHWDEVKIANALKDSYTYGPDRMVDIVNWPAYLDDGSGHLQTSQYAEYAAFAAQLVRIINIKLGYHVKYWEVFNELDGPGNPYDGNMATAGKIYNQVAAAKKAEDPRILVGGPAYPRADLTNNVDDFFSVTAQNLDFTSLHSYSIGTTCGYDPDNKVVYDDAAVGWLDSSTIAQFAKYSSRTIEDFHDEFNISYCPPDVRMTNEIGAVYDALAMVDIFHNGAYGSMAWNEADGWYGKLNNDANWTRRPASYLYQYLNRDMQGAEATTTSSDTEKVVLFATQSRTMVHLMLINRTGSEQKIRLSFTGLPSGICASTSFTAERVSDAGGNNPGDVTYETLTTGSGYRLPGNTVTILNLKVHDR